MSNVFPPIRVTANPIQLEFLWHIFKQISYKIYTEK